MKTMILWTEPRVVALGVHAVTALGGTSLRVRQWGTWIATRGSVPVRETRALDADTLARIDAGLILSAGSSPR